MFWGRPEGLVACPVKQRVTVERFALFGGFLAGLPIGSTCVMWSTKSRFPKYTVILPFEELFLNTLEREERETNNACL